MGWCGLEHGQRLQTLFLFLSEHEESVTCHLFASYMPPEDGQMMFDDFATIQPAVGGGER